MINFYIYYSYPGDSMDFDELMEKGNQLRKENKYEEALDAYQAALSNDFHLFVETRGQSILNAINKVCHVDDDTQTINSNMDESEQENLLDGTMDNDA